MSFETMPTSEEGPKPIPPQELANPAADREATGYAADRAADLIEQHASFSRAAFEGNLTMDYLDHMVDKTPAEIKDQADRLVNDVLARYLNRQIGEGLRAGVLKDILSVLEKDMRDTQLSQAASPDLVRRQQLFLGEVRNQLEPMLAKLEHKEKPQS
ncbi:MAG TPA: hypothetical protein VMT99_01200 [Candidatus Paceibacterota bacterium]|nr:hypothetical protein [Candidatus Paceibacterota bacterium]